MVAGLNTFVQYRLMLMYSLHNDRMMAQLTLKNGVLFTSILVLTYGLDVPKSWRRAAMVVGPLASYRLLHWSARLASSRCDGMSGAWMKSETPRLFLYSFDAITLLILAAGAAFGARTEWLK